MNPSLEGGDGKRVDRWVGGFSKLETHPSSLLTSGQKRPQWTKTIARAQANVGGGLVPMPPY